MTLQSDQSNLNNVTAALLLALIALAPLPVGSNRPAYWAISAVLVGLLAMVYVLSLLRLGAPFRADFKALRMEFGLFGLFAFYVIITILPLGIGAALAPAPRLDLIADMSGSPFAPISIAPGQTQLSLLKMVSYGVIFLLGIQVAINADRARNMMFWIVVIVTGYAVVGLSSLYLFDDTFLGFPKENYLGSATGTFINRNSFATFLGLGLCAAGALSVSSLTRPRVSRAQNDGIDGIAFALSAAVIGACILATQSRMGIFADAIGLALTVFLAAHPKIDGQKRSPILFVAIVAGVLVIVTLYGGGALERLGSVDTSADVRLDLYKQVIELIGLRPLSGFGAGTFELAFPFVHSLPVSTDYYWDKAHNTYLTLIAECGLFFGMIPILIIGLISWKILKVRNRSGNRRTVAAIALGATAIVALHSLVDFSLEIHAVALLYVLCLAVGAAAAYLPDRPRDVA